MTFSHYDLGWAYPGRSSEKIVLLALAEHADKGGLAYPGYGRIARLTGLHRSTVIRAITVLEEDGVIKVERTTTRDGKTRNRYHLVALCDWSHDATSSRTRRRWSHSDTGVVAQCDEGSRTVIPEPTNEPTSEPITEPTREELLSEL